MAKMLAAVLHDFNDLLLEEVERPEPKEVGRVVVQNQVVRVLRHRLQGHHRASGAT